MSNLGSVSPARSAAYQSSSSTKTSSHAVRPAARQQEETGLAARVKQLGPTLGTAVATVEAVEDVAAATYTAALSGMNKLGHAAEAAVDTVSHALSVAGDAVHSVEDAISSAADTVSDAAHTVADRFSAGLDKLGKMVDFSA